MNRVINSAILIAIAAAAFDASAIPTSTRSAKAAVACRTAVQIDADGARLRYDRILWTAPADASGHTLVYRNAWVTVDGKQERRRVQCDVANVGKRVIASAVVPGEFVPHRNS